MSLFISCEGLGLTGKTTISKIILQYYKVKGYNIIFIDDILDTEIGRMVKLYLPRFQEFKKTIFYLSCANILTLQNNLKEILKNSDILLIENYLTIQFLSILDYKNELNIFKLFKKSIKTPNLVVFFRSKFNDIKKREKNTDFNNFLYNIKNETELQSINNKLISKIDSLNLRRIIVDTSKNTTDESAKFIIEKINGLLK